MDETRKLVALIEDMMISESKRFVTLRLRREILPMAERDHIHQEMQRTKTTLQSLAPSALLCSRNTIPGSSSRQFLGPARSPWCEMNLGSTRGPSAAELSRALTACGRGRRVR